MYLSLCMPTNGISEWVFPALDSIYEQGVAEDRFEVVVTDNGNNDDFQRKMDKYVKKHTNIFYKKTEAYMFDNQLEALKYAKGDYLKFVNHRSIWIPGRLESMIKFVEENVKDKPVLYFSNGAMGWGPMYKEFSSFDDFVRNLGVYATWTSGVGIWKEDYDKLPPNFVYDKISPHSSVLYSERKKEKYIINDKHWMKEIETDHSKKGKYDLYKAFALDEFIITINLYRDGDISADTLKHVKESFRDNLKYFYYFFNLKKTPCSYDLNGFDKYVDIFFDSKDIVDGGMQRYNEENVQN